MVHLQNHVGEVVLPHHHAIDRQTRSSGIEVDRLVRLHDPLPFAVFAPKLEAHGAEALDDRAAHRGDHFAQGGKALRRVFVGGAGAIAYYPGGLRGGVPEL